MKSIDDNGQIHIWLNSWDDTFSFDNGDWLVIPGVGVLYWQDGERKHARVLPFHKIEAFDILYEN